MFTGIVETIGTVAQVTAHAGNIDVTITDCAEILVDCKLGDSIAVNGVCLTVTRFTSTEFSVGVSAETLRKTDLGNFKAGSKVNLERAMASVGSSSSSNDASINTRYGGHYVQGHIDGVAEICAIEPDNDDSLVFTFQWRAEDQDLVNYIVQKGFVCVDGTSLTVTHVNYKEHKFSIMMVKYTQSKVIMPLKKVGDTVNVEVDVSAKVVRHQVELQLESQLLDDSSPLAQMIQRIVEQKLAGATK